MLRIEYDRVAAYHGYRQGQPWDTPGAVRLAIYDGANGGGPDRRTTTNDIRDLERRLIRDAIRDGVPAQADNHYGFTVVVDSSVDERTVSHTYLHLRFSDGLLYVWLEPVGHRPTTSRRMEPIVVTEGDELPVDDVPWEGLVDDPLPPSGSAPFAEGEVSHDDLTPDELTGTG